MIILYHLYLRIQKKPKELVKSIDIPDVEALLLVSKEIYDISGAVFAEIVATGNPKCVYALF